MLATRFGKIIMVDDGSFDEFYAKLNDMVNFSFNLGEGIIEAQIVRKVMISLPQRFKSMVYWYLRKQRSRCYQYRRTCGISPNL